jgi:hypothetical protein
MAKLKAKNRKIFVLQWNKPCRFDSWRGIEIATDVYRSQETRIYMTYKTYSVCVFYLSVRKWVFEIMAVFKIILISNYK